MRGWVVPVVLVGAAGCGFDGNPASGDAADTDAPAGVDAPDIDADPGAPDARPDARPSPPDAPNPDAPIVLMCPPGYAPIPNGTSLYRFVGTGDDWLAAEQDCENDGSGSHLVVFDNGTERDAVQDAIADDAWIGISDRNNEGVWIAVNGQLNPLTGGLGGGSPTRNCGRLKDSNGSLEEQECADVDTYVCECDGKPGDPANY